MATTARRRDARGRYIPTYTVRYEHAIPSAPTRVIKRTDRTAAEVERLGTLLVRQPEEQLYNIAVLDRRGDDVTFGFKCFQGTDESDRECPSCGAPADETGYHIPEHRPGCPYTVDYRAV